MILIKEQLDHFQRQNTEMKLRLYGDRPRYRSKILLLIQTRNLFWHTFQRHFHQTVRLSEFEIYSIIVNKVFTVWFTRSPVCEAHFATIHPVKIVILVGCFLRSDPCCYSELVKLRSSEVLVVMVMENSKSWSWPGCHACGLSISEIFPMSVLAVHLFASKRFETTVPEFSPASLASTARGLPWVRSRMNFRGVGFTHKSVRLGTVIVVPCVATPVITLGHTILSIASIIRLSITPAEEHVLYCSQKKTILNALGIIDWWQICPVKLAI